ncbi:TPA: hypothetical protein ACPHXB_006129, partial [Pseudomonas aeruginosa]
PIKPAATAVVPILRRSSAIAESFADPMVFLDEYRKTTLRDGFPAGLVGGVDQQISGSTGAIS